MTRHSPFKNESGATVTIELLIYVPLAIAFIGFILNSAFHWTTYFYVQGVVNDAASYTAIAGGNLRVPYVPNGGYDLLPTEYISQQLGTNPFVTKVDSLRCYLVDGRSQVNGVARCDATYRTLVFPTDPLTARYFGQPMFAVAEDLSQTAYNPNL